MFYLGRENSVRWHREFAYRPHVSGKHKKNRRNMTSSNLKCPKCGEFIIPKHGIYKTTASYSDCLRSCDKCEIGFSNAKNKPTIIYKNHHHNIPDLLRQDLDNSLNNSLNIFNRKNKKNKFGFSTSEDALTWSFFKYFAVEQKYSDLLELLNIDSAETEFDIYLWGTKITNLDNDSELIDKLIKTSDFFKESSSKRTEPDVIITLVDKIIFIEVKYLSQNEITANSNKFTKYLIPEIETKELLESGHYELFRNWVFASNLSGGKEFCLINLGPKRLFVDKNKDKLFQFEKALKSINGNFSKVSWEDILARINISDYEAWFKKYLNEKLSASR